MEAITNKQSFAIIISFMLCNGFSVLFGTDCGRDVWIAYILAAVFTIFLWYLTSSLYEKYGFTSFFDMLSHGFGKVCGIISATVLAIYALLSCTTSLSIFGKFTQISALARTPQIVLPLIILVTAAFALRAGFAVFARCSVLFLPFLIFTFISLIFFGLPQLDFKNITPVLQNGVFPVSKSALTVFTNQFGDALILLAIYPYILKNPKRKKVTLRAIIIATLIASIIAFFTVLTLGSMQTEGEFFPVFTILSIRKVGAYIQHMEILTSVAMTFSVFVRQAVGLYFIALAIRHIFKITAEKFLFAPLALIIASGTQLLYGSMMSLRWRTESNLNIYMLLPLQLILPCLMCIFLIFKNKKGEG